MSNAVGIYIHIPFCARRCNYCDFYSGASKEKFDEYEKSLLSHIERFEGVSADTVYFGGGTPTFFGAERLCRVLDKIKNVFALSDDCEITAECNPKTVNENGLYLMRTHGFNRLSVGLQSAVEDELRVLGRIHSPTDGYDVIKTAKSVGFDNISVDLMYGIPYQTVDTFKCSLEFAAEMQTSHVSAYMLKLEEGTPMYQNRLSLVFPDDDEVCRMAEICNDYLENNGLHRYEISNYAKFGMESRHNLKYWNREEYISFGPSASSFYKGRRYTYCHDINGYIDFCNDVKTEKEILCEEEFPSKSEAEAEYLMLALRLVRGVDKAEYKRRFNKDFDTEYGNAVLPFVKGGFMQDGDNIRFTPKGFNVSNTILAEILKFE